MKQLLVSSFFVVLLGMPAIGQSVEAVAKKPQESADEKILLQMERDWNDALKTRDVTWLEQNLAGDMTEIASSNGSLLTKTESINLFKTNTTIYESLELSDLRVRVEGNAGIVIGVNHIKARDGEGKLIEVRFAFTDAYVKREGHWQVWASQHTRITP